MARPCVQNGSPLTPMHCPHLGARREKEPGSTTRDMEKDSGKGGLRSWAEAATAAKGRTTWKERACGPIPRLGTHGK